MRLFIDPAEVTLACFISIRPSFLSDVTRNLSFSSLSTCKLYLCLNYPFPFLQSTDHRIFTQISESDLSSLVDARSRTIATCCSGIPKVPRLISLLSRALRGCSRVAGHRRQQGGTSHSRQGTARGYRQHIIISHGPGTHALRRLGRPGRRYIAGRKRRQSGRGTNLLGRVVGGRMVGEGHDGVLHHRR